MNTPRLLVASNNPHKLQEIVRALGIPSDRVATPDAWKDHVDGPLPDPVEDGDDYLANARIKAMAFSHWAGIPALADDSGLEVDALDGRPGIYSARYAGPDVSYAENNARILGELSDLPQEGRTARFICVIAVCDGNNPLYDTRGVCEGSIADAPRGGAGFGYDPVFIPEVRESAAPEPGGRTFAEMAPDEKDRISHRGRALQALRADVREGRFPVSLES